MILETNVLVVIVAAITEAIKRFSALNSRFVPVLAIVVGVVVAYIQGLDLLLGVVVGLTSSGLYDLTAKTLLNK